jgi:regulator of sigma E protease
MARLVGVKVEVFSIGFGKKLFCKKFGQTDWCVSSIPLGGYVQMKGQDDSDPLKRSDDPDSYTSKSPWQRILILLGGPGFNFLLAFMIYMFLAFHGWQKLAPVVGGTLKNTPAYGIFKKGDEILSINGIKIKTWDDIGKLVSEYDVLRISVKRGNKIVHVTIKPKKEKIKNIFNQLVERKLIGIYPYGKIVTVRYHGIQALKVAWNQFVSSSEFILKSIEKLITGAIGLNQLSGPIGIVDVTAKVAKLGMQPLLLLTALLSVNLGILNLFPIPALDGGHIMFNLFEAITKKEVNEEIMYKLTVAGWIFLGCIMFIGIYNDIHRLIGG